MYSVHIRIFFLPKLNVYSVEILVFYHIWRGSVISPELVACHHTFNEFMVPLSFLLFSLLIYTQFLTTCALSHYLMEYISCPSSFIWNAFLLITNISRESHIHSSILDIHLSWHFHYIFMWINFSQKACSFVRIKCVLSWAVFASSIQF